MPRNPNRRRPGAGDKHAQINSDGCERCGCSPVVPSTGLCAPCSLSPAEEIVTTHATPKSLPR